MKQKIDQKVMHKQHSVEKAKLQAQLAHQLKSQVEEEAE
jgi:hypothetical protein